MRINKAREEGKHDLAEEAEYELDCAKEKIATYNKKVHTNTKNKNLLENDD